MLGGGPFFHILVIFSIQVAQRHSFLLSSRPPSAALFLLHNQQNRVKVPITTTNLSSTHPDQRIGMIPTRLQVIGTKRQEVFPHPPAIR